MTATESHRFNPIARWRKTIVAFFVLSLTLTALAPVAANAAVAEATLSVIVEHQPDTDDTVRSLIEDLGGTVTTDLAVVDVMTAELPADAVNTLRAAGAVIDVTPDSSVRLLDAGWEDTDKDSEIDADNFQPATYAGSMETVTDVTGAQDYWNKDYTGAGVDIALIDSGVLPVDGLTVNGKVINGADLSLDAQSDALRHLDAYGHGTHLAGIMVGRDDAVEIDEGEIEDGWVGMAPDARLLNIKVGDAHGAVDVSQVIAAIDWVVQHRNDNGMNVRVINLSFGTDGTQDYLLDPLTHAVEVAWHHGIVVVVAAGNDGNDALLRNPAYDPFVIAVGATDSQTTYSAADDIVTDFTNCGTDARHIDVVAPGKSIVSLRAPGSKADLENPKAVVEDRFFLGSGTSQAAAVVSGAAALIIEQRPDITPDEVKALLMNTAQEIPGAKSICQGAGLIDLGAALGTATPQATQNHAQSQGTGLLEGARGTHHLIDLTPLQGMDITDELIAMYYEKLFHNGYVLHGEQDIFGNAWNGASWSGASWSGTSWSGGSWNGASWTGTSWSGTSWSGTSWSGTSWSGTSWSGTSWSGTSWSGASWSGTSWSGGSWSSLRWD